MDELNINFDPTDEYESIESQEKPLIDNKQQKPQQDIATEKPQEVNTQQNANIAVEQKTQIPNQQYVHQQPYVQQPFVPQPQQTFAPQPPQPPVYYNQYGANIPNTVVPPVINPNVAQPVYGSAPYYPAQPQNAPAYMPVQPPQAYTNMHSNANHVMNPYVQNSFAMPNTNGENKKTSAKAKVFIASMIVLLVLFTIAIVAIMMGTNNHNKKANNDDHPLSGFATEPESMPDSYFDYAPNFSPYKESDIDVEITLQPDEGQTQNSVNKGKSNTYPANKDAKSLKAESLPKDKDSSKYTAQSSYKAVTDSVVTIECYEKVITGKQEDIIGSGTGTIISSDGYIVTNSHVILNSNSYKINVTLNNAKEYEAKIVGFDTRTDIAVLKIDAKNLSAVKFADSSKVVVGQDIVAIGTPGGAGFQNSLTKGIVSAVEREIDISKTVKYIQTDAAINPGNSGGPLCNLYGQIIGINTAKISDVDYEGMGFAIPSNTVLEIANDLIHYGYVKGRVRLGITGIAITEYDAYDYDIPQGVLIKDIDENGPFADTKAQSYDIITAINGEQVTSFEDIFGELEKYKAGDKVTVTLHRIENKD